MPLDPSKTGFCVLYHSDVSSVDIPALGAKMRGRIKQVIETRLAVAPQDYGRPLKKTLKGYWKLRVGDYRVVFKVVDKEVWIFAITHRRNVYAKIKKRI